MFLEDLPLPDGCGLHGTAASVRYQRSWLVKSRTVAKGKPPWQQQVGRERIAPYVGRSNMWSPCVIIIRFFEFWSWNDTRFDETALAFGPYRYIMCYLFWSWSWYVGEIDWCGCCLICTWPDRLFVTKINSFHSGQTFPAEIIILLRFCEELLLSTLHFCEIIAFVLHIGLKHAIARLSHPVVQMECGYSKPTVLFEQPWLERRFLLREGFDGVYELISSRLIR